MRTAHLASSSSQPTVERLATKSIRRAIRMQIEMFQIARNSSFALKFDVDVVCVCVCALAKRLVAIGARSLARLPARADIVVGRQSISALVARARVLSIVLLEKAAAEQNRWRDDGETR